MADETLTCAHDGHTWTREVTRGKKPRFCAEHRPVVEARPKADHAPRSLSSDDALEVLCSDDVEPELRRKLEFCYESLDNAAYVGRREEGDIRLLVQRQHELVREHNRSGKAA